MSPTPPPHSPSGPSPASAPSSNASSATVAEDKMDEEHEKHEKDADELSPVPERDQAKLAVPTLDLAVSTSPSLQESDVRTLSRPPSRNTSPTSDTPATVTAVSDEADPEAQREPDIYDRFSPARKRMIVAIVSYAAFIGPIASSAFLPSIKVMADEMHTTPSVINYTVAIFIVSIAIAPLVWSPLSGFYGRKPVYLMSMPIMTVASIGVAQSRTVGDIIGTRILQGIGSSAVLSVGAGTVGDIYRPTERANAMAWFYSGVLLGPALSPILAGMFTEYTAITWRATQYFMCGASALAFALLALCFPETSHPVLPHHAAQKARGKKFVLYVFNPLVSLGLLQYGNIVMATIASSFIMLQTYCVMVPLSVIFQERYNIHNVAVAGCVYLSVGVGTLIGSRIGGPLSDRTVLKYMKKRGYRRPEDRLHATLLGAGLINPASCLVYGWLLWANKGGMAPPLVMLVINGVGMNLSLTPLNTYLVDSSQKRSAEAIAVNNFWRYLFAAAASAFVLPMIEAIGPGWTMTFASAMAWVAFGCIVATMRFGEGWRESANARIARRAAKAEAKAEVEEDEKEAAGKVPAPVVEEKAPPRPGSPIGIGFAAREDDGEFLDLEHDAVFLNELEHELEHERERHAHAHDRPSASETQPKPETDHKKKERHGLGDRLRHFAHTHHVHNPLSRRHSTTSSDHDHGEAEHGEPTHLVQLPRARVRGRGTLTRERSRRSSGATLPSVGEVLQRTVSLSGASVHG